MLEDMPGAIVSLKGGQSVPFCPPLEVRLGHVVVVLIEHYDGLEDDFEKGLRACALQLGFGLLRKPRHEAWVQDDHILAKDGAEVELLEGVAADRSALAAASGRVALFAESAAGTAGATLCLGVRQATPIR